MVDRSRYLNQIEPFMGKDVIKVLTGMRRSGKSTLLEQIQTRLIADGVDPGNIVSMNFESMRYEDLTSSHRAFYQEVARRVSGMDGRAYLFFDEIQEVPQWERVVDSLRVDFDCDIYLSGSNSKLLGGELASLLSGRYVALEIMPFSFAEMLQTCPETPAGEAFETYRVLGGLPFLSHIGYAAESSRTYLKDVFNSIVLKDIVARHAFRNVEQLERVLAYLMSEAGTTLSIDNMANVMRESGRSISREVIYNYLDAAEEAMLITRVKRQDLKGREVLRGGEKAYVTDIGLREAVLGSNAARIDLVLENLVFCELKRRGYTVFVGRNGAREIDFVAEASGELVYVQVAYLLASERTVEREFDAYIGLPDNYPKYVVSMDRVDMSRDGIRHMNIEDFLLAEAW